MFIITIEIAETALIFTIPDEHLLKEWRIPENFILKEMGDRILIEKKYLGIKAPSAVLPDAYNYLLNSLYPGYYNLVK